MNQSSTTKVINLLGAPGTGKSTIDAYQGTAVNLFNRLFKEESTKIKYD